MTTYLEAEVEYHTDALKSIERGRIGVSVEYVVRYHVHQLEWLEKMYWLCREVWEA